MRSNLAISAFLIAALVALFVYTDAGAGSATGEYTDTCTGCHLNPKYKKEDAHALKECISCHASKDHPLNERAEVRLITKAYAGPGDRPTPEEGTVKREVEPDLKNMVLIEEGEFLMGSDDRLRDERPSHVVYIGSFYIDRYEVTKKDYKKFIDATGRQMPDEWENGSYPEDRGDHPVTYVTWYDADAYCKWAGKRLPREREWEKGARGSDGRIYPWGNEWDLNKSNNPLRAIEETKPVGSFPKGVNQFGLYDMSGNVWEWVDEGYNSHPGSDYINPEFGENYALLKGGSWWDCMFYGCGISAPTFNRAFFDPTTKSDSYGFRCAADNPSTK
ncbi:MAG: formylglycine-generating enzyme family protein [Deltaproteobacteria bacterium]|nr:formylglycine-generating enzyme family protein [Deltaproteobacteria bacterium]